MNYQRHLDKVSYFCVSNQNKIFTGKDNDSIKEQALLSTKF